MRRVLHRAVNYHAHSQLPQGKPAGTRCANLTDRNECSLYGRPERPTFCTGWQPVPEICGAGFAAAMEKIAALERDSA